MVTRSHKDSLIEEICNQLRPLKKKNVNIASEVKQRLELFDKVNPKLMPVTNAKAINTAAKLFRAKFRKDKLADLLRETLPYIFKALDEQFEQLEKIEGPDVRFDTSKWLTAEFARILIKEFSKRPPTGTAAKGPLRTIASLIHEFRTGERDKDLKRACDAVVKA
jgi:type I site-specific restriction endonuclease